MIYFKMNVQSDKEIAIQNITRLVGYTFISFISIFTNNTIYNYFLKIIDYVKNLVINHNFLKKILDVAFKHEYLDFDNIKANLQNQTKLEWD